MSRVSVVLPQPLHPQSSTHCPSGMVRSIFFKPPSALLKNGRAPLIGCYSEKTGKTYDAVVLLEDDGQRTGYKLVFDNG